MKKTRMKKTFAAVLTAALVLPTIGTSVFATENTANVVKSYNFIDELDALTYMSDTGMYEMSVPTVSEENPLSRDVLASFLPASITAEIEFAEDTDAEEQPTEEETTVLTDNEEELTVSDEENTPDAPDAPENDVSATEETPVPESTPAEGEDTETIPPTTEEPVIPDEVETDVQPESVPAEPTEEEPTDVPDEPTEEESADVSDEEPEPEITDTATAEVIPAGAYVLDITWDLSDYPESAWEGQYIITASLPDGYVLADDAIPMAVKVVLSDLVSTLEEPVDNDNEDVPEDVAEALNLIQALPTLKELQNKMTELSTQAQFAEYFANTVQSARDAYNALSDESKKIIEDDYSEVLAKLTALQYVPGTRAVSKSTENVAQQEDGNPYVFKYSSGAKFYQNSPHDDVVTFMLIKAMDDEYENKEWRPVGGVYEPGMHNNNIPGGNNNFFVAYCCDHETGAVYGTYYKRFNLEEAGYFDTDAAKRIRAICENSFPFVSGDTMRKMLEGQLKYDDGTVIDVNDIEDAELMTATQNAIWTVANDNTFNYSRTYTQGNWYYPMISRYDNDGVKHEDVGQRIDAIKDFLITLDKENPGDDEIVISSITEEEVTPVALVNAEEDIYRVMVKVALNSSGSGNKDDIKIRAEAMATGSTDEQDVKYGTKSYTLFVNAKPGETIQITVNGTQVLPSAVYFYGAEPTDFDEKQESSSNPGRNESQNFVGVASGETDVNCCLAVKLAEKVEDVIPTAATLNLKKVDPTGAALENAEFTLCYVGTNNQETAIGDYKSDVNGNVKIDGLMVGNTYRLKETKAPSGYNVSDTVIEFTVKDNGDNLAIIDYATKDIAMKDGAIQFVNTQKNTGGNNGGGSSKDKIRVTAEKDWEVPKGVEHPDSVKVRLYVDGAAYGKVITLDEDNDWTYTWSGIKKNADWEVKEVSVPGDYDVSYKTKGNKVVITNTYEQPSDSPTTPTEPTVPVEPTTPVVPTEPTVPADPTVPVTPETPTVPVTPETPAVPGETDDPTVPFDEEGIVLGEDEDNKNNEEDETLIASKEDISCPSMILGDTDSVPHTGDNNHIVLFGMIGILALAGIIVLRKAKSTK